MKKSIKIILSVLAIILILICILVRIFVKVDNNDIQVEELKNTFEYTSLEDLIPQYSLEEAKNDGVFVITQDSEVYNFNNYLGFLIGARDGKKSNIRVASEEKTGVFNIIDVECDTTNIKVSYRDGASQLISTEEYGNADGYKLVPKTAVLNDGSEWVGCYIINENTEDEIVLFGYINLEAEKVVISGENT